MSDQKQFHIFVCAADDGVADAVASKLQAQPGGVLGEARPVLVRAFGARDGDRLGGLARSCLFLPVVSENSLAALAQQDSGLLREWQAAVALNKEGAIDIIPLLVGSFQQTGSSRVFAPFDIAKFVSKLQGSSAKDTVEAVLSFPGIFLNPEDLNDKIAIIQSRLSFQVWPKFRQIYFFQLELGPEPTFTCVQCALDVKESENGVGACRFHAKPYNACCGTSGSKESGCQRQKHAFTHHNNFPYAAFWDWRSGLMNYTNMRQLFAVVVANDFAATSKPDRTVSASVGAILQSAGDKYSNKLFVDVECGGANAQVYFQTFSRTEVMDSANTQKSIVELIGSDRERVSVEWILDSQVGNVKGLHISCSTKTSLSPSTATVYFEWPSASNLNGPVLSSPPIFSQGKQFGEVPLPASLANSQNPYNFPESSLFQGRRIQNLSPRKRDDELPTWSSVPGGFHLRVLDTSVRHDGYHRVDYLTVEVAIINRSKETNLLLDGRVFAKLRLEGDDGNLVVIKERGEGDEDGDDFVATNEWKRLETVTWRVKTGGSSGSDILPISIPAFGTATIVADMAIQVHRYYPDNRTGSNCNFSWIAYRSGAPLVLDVELEDMNGEKFGGLVEFPLPALYLKSAEKEAVFVLETDDVDVCEREIVSIEMKKEPAYDAEYLDPREKIATEFAVGWTGRGMTFGIPTLRHIVNQAESQSPEKSETKQLGTYNLTPFFFSDEAENAQFRHSAYAVIDFQRRSVVAIRFTTESAAMKSVGYFRVPPYGDAIGGEEATDYVLGSLDSSSDLTVHGWMQEEKVLSILTKEEQLPKQGKPAVSLRVVSGQGAAVSGANTKADAKGGIDSQVVAEVLKPLLADAVNQVEERVTASFKKEIQVLVDRIKELESKQ
ncbi:hypothetical protein BDR26DRAFT_875064 [Obelidium mucronatum]|nr:hypothetical protein BDR26DRAFT_875064 [Obelidium mucronatum]